MPEVKQMLPNEPNHMRIALNKIWDYLSGEDINTVTFRQLISNCEGYHYYEDIYNAEAQRALWGIICMLELCFERSVQNTISVSKNVEDTLYEYMDYLMDNKYPDWRKRTPSEIRNIVSNHPFTIREMNKQSENLKLLKETPTLKHKTLDLLRNSFDNEGKSLLDLS